MLYGVFYSSVSSIQKRFIIAKIQNLEILAINWITQTQKCGNLLRFINLNYVSRGPKRRDFVITGLILFSTRSTSKDGEPDENYGSLQKQSKRGSEKAIPSNKNIFSHQLRWSLLYYMILGHPQKPHLCLCLILLFRSKGLF